MIVMTLNDTPPWGAPLMATATNVGSATAAAPIPKSRGRVQTVSA